MSGGRSGLVGELQSQPVHDARRLNDPTASGRGVEEHLHRRQVVKNSVLLTAASRPHLTTLRAD